MTERSAPGEAQPDGTVSRVLRLLSIFCEADAPLGINQISQQSSLPVSTVHRLVNLMVDGAFLQHEGASRLYSPGPELHRLTAMLWRSGPAVAAQPILDALSKQFNETVVFLLYLPDRLAISPIAKADGRRSLRYVADLNVALELSRGASGKSILAHLDEPTIRRIYDSADPAGQPLPEWNDFLAELELVRRRGYAATSGERIPGGQSVAVVVRGGLGEVVGGICMTFPRGSAVDHSIDEMGTAIAKAARQLSTRLGAQKASMPPSPFRGGA